MDRKVRSLALVLQSTPESGGANHYEMAIAQILETVCQEIGIKLHIFVTSDRSENLEKGSTWNDRFDDVKLIFQALLPKRLRFILRQTVETTFSKMIAGFGVDAVYFPSPNKFAVDRTLPAVISTVWDIGHRDLPFLPEMSGKGRWLLRELYFRVSLQNSKFVITDSLTTGEKLQKTYGVSESKILSMGLLPMNHDLPRGARLIDDTYFIYPAQKWRHKNHTTVLKAFKKVLASEPSLKLVFTGSDKGEGKKIIRQIAALGLTKSVLDLGFVSQETLINLQHHAVALLMPSLLGPTNIPPLDALNLGTHAIVSDAHSFEVEIQNMLTVVPATNSDMWANAMLDALVKKAPPSLRHSSDKAKKALGAMLESLSLDQ